MWLNTAFSRFPLLLEFYAIKYIVPGKVRDENYLQDKIDRKTKKVKTTQMSING